MAPQLTLYDNSGRVILDQVSSNADISHPLQPEDIDPNGLVLTVQHVDTAAATGEYSLSVGEPLPPGGGGSSADRVFLGRCDCGIPNDFAPDGRRLSDIIQNRLAGALEQPDKNTTETVRRLGVELWQEGLLDQQGVAALVSCAIDYALGRCQLIN